MSILLNGDCLEELKDIDNNFCDLIFCDLPYATDKYSAVNCKWNTPVDLDKLWIELMRIKKLHTPIIMTCNMKFGVHLINTAPKKCPFRYELIWAKSSSSSFLLAKKMPLKSHELVFFFYEKLPFYDLSSHKHKFIDKKKVVIIDGETFNTKNRNKPITRVEGGYDPPLPKSIVKEDVYNYTDRINNGKLKATGNAQFEGANGKPLYDPPLPKSVIKEEKTQISKAQEKDLYGASAGGTIGAVHGTNYNPPLPKSVIKDIDEKYKNKGGLYSDVSRNGLLKNEPHYDPPLPKSVISEGGSDGSENNNNKRPDYKTDSDIYGDIQRKDFIRKNGESMYDPALPNSLLEIKSTRGSHSTEKPVALMEWILKYYSKEGDVILDPTMGSGSMGVACKNMNRNFIGIERDEKIYEVAVNRIED